jgi:hypothetical protein
MRKIGNLPCLGIEEICRQSENNNHDDKYDVILPSDALQGDWIDEGIEEDRKNR